MDTSKKFTLTYLSKLKEQVQQAIPGDIPATVKIDHRQADNPFLSHYGTNWEQEIK